MNWIDAIKTIREAQENNQLVIFVGAGVSKNSDVPTWIELIKRIADKIGYDKCSICGQNDGCSSSNECNLRYDFTQEEMLKIPEYYYNKLNKTKICEYYNFIQEVLKSDKESNAIDDEVFNILPHHIITTNFDSLLEESTTLNRKLYTVVSQDSELLSRASDRYILKMHGDLNIPQSVVLKESDYISYEQNHPLIGTFIRSLLVNHTFLFIGYSLNDYNLKLIIGWIDYFKNIHKIKKRPSNFFVTPKVPSKYEDTRLENMNIFTIGMELLPDDLVRRLSVPQSVSDLNGIKLFSFLRCITDHRILQYYVSLKDILVDKYKVLESYDKISFEDLINVQPLGTTEFISTRLRFYDREWYEKIDNLLAGRSKIVKEVFQRAGISSIELYTREKRRDICLTRFPIDTFIRISMDNNYVELLDKLDRVHILV